MISRLLRRNFILLFIIAVLLILFSPSCDKWRSLTGRSSLLERVRDPFPFALDVTPLVDADYLPILLAEIDAATDEILISMYLVQQPVGECTTILDALRRAAARGVSVQALFEKAVISNHDFAAHLVTADVDARIDDGRSRLHDKALLIDNGVMIVGSHNWSNAALVRNRELSFRVRGEAAAFQEWRARFETRFGDAERPDQSPSTVRPSSAAPPSRPAGAPPSFAGRGRIVIDHDYVLAASDLLSRTDNDLIAALYYVSLTAIEERGLLAEIGRTLKRSRDGGLRAVVILDQMKIAEEGDRENREAIKTMASWGVTAEFDPEEITHHVKAMVGGARFTLAGSHNWTTSSTRFNAETSLLVDSPKLAGFVRDYLESLRATSRERGSTADQASPVPSQRPISELIRIH